MFQSQSTSTECFALQNMTILNDFWGEYRKMLPNVIFFHYGNSIFFFSIGDKVTETAIGSKQGQIVAIKLPPTSPKYSPKPVKSP